MNSILFNIERDLFLESVFVRELEGEEAQQVVAACLAGGLTLEQAK